MAFLHALLVGLELLMLLPLPLGLDLEAEDESVPLLELDLKRDPNRLQYS